MPPTLPADAAAWIRGHIDLRPQLGVVLGSGFASVADFIEKPRNLPYAAIPGFVPTSVAGHPGRLVLGRLAGIPAAILAGRLHTYEGHDLATVTHPVRVLAELGIHTLLLTNASGGIRGDLEPGDLVAITDHLNLLGDNPLRHETGAPSFLDLTGLYDPALIRHLQDAADAVGVALQEGVYAAVCGPSFETPAEIRALRTLGADLVGMSTVPEAIVGRRCGLRVAALSCVSNRAAGLGGRISHDDIIAVGERVGLQAGRLIAEFTRLAAAP